MDKIKKPTYKELAGYLGVSESAVKQYPQKKRLLMQLGLWKLKDIQRGSQIALTEEKNKKRG